MLTKTDMLKLEAKFVTKDEFITRFDAVMFELKAIREELTIIAYRQGDHSDRLERIESLLERHFPGQLSPA